MSSTNGNKHLTLAEREIILTGITNGSTKTAIARTLGKEKSTIGKEIKHHRVLSHKYGMPLECTRYKGCVYGRNCTLDCPEYEPFHCSRRDRSPGACNGCKKWTHCRFDKYTYSPAQADKEYRETLLDSRLGVNLTSNEAARMGEIIVPLLKQGLSPYEILEIHPELDICEKTLYSYIENDVFHETNGITVLDLRRQVSRKLPKKKAVIYKKRQDNKYLQGRTYKDYLAYIEENPNAFATQMNTLYNDETNGPFLQTYKFLLNYCRLNFCKRMNYKSILALRENSSIAHKSCFFGIGGLGRKGRIWYTGDARWFIPRFMRMRSDQFAEH